MAIENGVIILEGNIGAGKTALAHKISAAIKSLGLKSQTHEVIFAGQDEVIEFKHTAYSKAVFAKGAVEAAKFLNGKGAGHYDMADVIAAK